MRQLELLTSLVAKVPLDARRHGIPVRAAKRMANPLCQLAVSPITHADVVSSIEHKRQPSRNRTEPGTACASKHVKVSIQSV